MEPDYPYDDSIVAARHLVAHAMNKLRYSGSVLCYVPDPADGSTDLDFLEKTAQWLDEFNQVLVTISDTTTDMARELHDLRSQRKAVRDFLGLPTTLGETQ
jgi:hypothetical protein